MSVKRVHYYSLRGWWRHSISSVHHLVTNILIPLALLTLLAFATGAAFYLFHTYAEKGLLLLAALLATSLRLLIAYALSLLVGIPLAMLGVANRRVESFLLPIYDVLESMPILAFFPVIILFFVTHGWLEGAAIFVIFFSVVWNIVFNVIGGLKTIPSDIYAVGVVFKLSPLARFRRITLPALFPALVTGSILAIAEGWNLIIVAEALHAYAPRGSEAEDLFGIGSLLVESAASGDKTSLVAATSILVVAIVIFNLFLWQPLLTKSSQYKFE